MKALLVTHVSKRPIGIVEISETASNHFRRLPGDVCPIQEWMDYSAFCGSFSRDMGCEELLTISIKCLETESVVVDYFDAFANGTFSVPRDPASDYIVTHLLTRLRQ
jgi:hypothetical protein